MSKFSSTPINQIGQLINGSAGDMFGFYSDISDSGNRLIVGGAGNNSNAGIAKVYQWNGKQWVQLGNDITGASNERMGRPVGISGNGSVIVVGGRGPSNNGIYRIYTLNGNSWSLRATLNGEASDDLGNFEHGSIDLSYDGSFFAFGHGQNDAGGNNRGHARIFEWNNTNYVQRGSDIDGDIDTSYLGSGAPGISLSKDGKRIVVGLRIRSSSNGMVRVYDWNGSAWTKVGADITDPVDSSGSVFGGSVSISNDGQTIIAGAQNGNNTGLVHIFAYQLISGTASWTYKSTIAGSNSGDGFGYSSSINGNGNKIIVGAYTANSNRGYARIYNWDGTTASQIGSDILGAATNNYLGGHVTLSANGIAVIGAPFNASGGASSGQVKVIGTDRYEYSWDVDSPSAPSNGNYIASIAAIDKVDNVYSCLLYTSPSPRDRG